MRIHVQVLNSSDSFYSTTATELTVELKIKFKLLLMTD